MSIISREAGEQRFWVGDHTDARTCRAHITANIPAGGTLMNGRAPGAVIQPLPRSAMGSTDGRG